MGYHHVIAKREQDCEGGDPTIPEQPLINCMTFHKPYNIPRPLFSPLCNKGLRQNDV